MQLGQLKAYFSTSPAIRLLRSPNAAYIVHFLAARFKNTERISISHSELLASLLAYQEDLREVEPESLPSPAETYLTEWCSSDSRWLQRFLETHLNEPAYQLTPHAEEVLSFLDRGLNQDLGFVGTESRLKLIIDALSDLAVGASNDPEVRLQHLRVEQARIQDEIARIERDGLVSQFQPAQIRERFATAVALLRQLQGDFRAVEQSFRDITTQVQQRQLDGDETRGRILEFALDAEDLLKHEDQGVSFYEFVRLILSPSQMERLEEVIVKVRQLPDLQQHRDGLETVRGMITTLQQEAEKVMRTNQRLSATLRRLLDFRTHGERQRVTQLLRAIQSTAAKLQQAPSSFDVGLTLEVECRLNSPFRRAFWTESPRLDAIDLTTFAPDADERRSAFERLAALPAIDWKAMRMRVRQMLTLEHSPSLGDLLHQHPVDGIVEVIAYLQIAVEDGHLVDSTSSETVTVNGTTAQPIAVTIPRVKFLPPRRNGHAQ